MGNPEIVPGSRDTTYAVLHAQQIHSHGVARVWTLSCRRLDATRPASPSSRPRPRVRSGRLCGWGAQASPASSASPPGRGG